ncbi:MAG: aminotransferase class V-fold PLP-dependent enzyme [Meiothermus sp.]|nr:aminotransferase class V-fold PLP-dependent enzyme [Meiothermus sp.]
MRADFEDAISRASSYVREYLQSVHEQRVFPGAEELRLLEEFDEPMPHSPTDVRSVLEQLHRLGSPNTVASMGGRYFGFVTGGALPAALGAKLLGTAWDQNNGARAGSPVAARLEELALRWLIELFGLPEGSTGAFVTGASMANFSALAAARHALLRRQGWSAEEDGLFGAPEVKVVVCEESHSTVFKALQMVGFGRNRVHKVPTDPQGRMRVELLPELDGHTLVCLQAGNVNSGAFDDIAAVCARANGAWIHVDGAFGMWAAASPEYAHLVRGLEQADSWATDGHKWLNTPYDCGIVFVKDARALRSAFALSNAPYLQMQATAEREPLEYTPEASRRARGIEVWAALKQLGRGGVRDLIERCCANARQFAVGFRMAGLEVPHEVFINQVMVGFGDEETTRRVIKAVQEDGTLWAGGTVWKGRTFMRLSCSSWRTTSVDVERSLGAILRAAERAGAIGGNR